MSFKVYSQDDLPREAWERLTGGSFISSPEFCSIWQALGGRGIFFADEESGVFVAGMAGVEFGSWPIKRFASMPDGLYGGPFIEGNPDEAGKREFVSAVAGELRARKYIRADIYSFFEDTDYGREGFVRRESFTHLISLSEGVYRPPDPKIGSHIRHGQREGSAVAILDDEKYFDRFCELVRATDRRHARKTRYDREFFRRLLEVARKDGRVIWPMLVHGGEMIGSHIYFKERSQLFHWQSYSEVESRSLKPNHLLLDYAINYAREHKIETVNLGGSPPDAEGLIKFKESWGGKRITYPYYTYYSGLGRFLYRGRRA